MAAGRSWEHLEIRCSKMNNNVVEIDGVNDRKKDPRVGQPVSSVVSRLGTDGWEVVAAFDGSDAYHLWLKRET